MDTAGDGMGTAGERRIIQFQIIREPDHMVGSRNDGGGLLLFFSLDSTGQLWRGTADDVRGEPTWSKVTGPFDPARAGR
jgi:hypothetical protein